MKNQITKKVFTSIVMMMIAYTFANAQNCPTNKVWTCRTSNCVQECKCVLSNNVTQWQANGQPCQWPPCFCQKPIPASCRTYCSPFRLSANGTTGETALTGIYPNPVSSSATISFYLSQSQKASLLVFDMSGRLVITLADKVFDEGDNELVWETDEVNAGVYFLHFQSAENFQTEKLFVTK